MIEIITEADYKDRLAATQNGVLLFFKKLCPHCKNMEKRGTPADDFCHQGG